MTIRNIFACLVHESPECVIDLVRNLRFLDPSSVILLYNGGPTRQLLDCGFPLEHYGVMLHPSPRPMAWGRLHEFALDCMRFALQELPFDTLTIVDSDQLGTRAGYSGYLAQFLHGRNRIGLLSSSPGVWRHRSVSPVRAALSELDLWRPFLRRFPQGEQKFAHWSFWPSTVFTSDAARELTALFAADRELQDIMARTRIWATEEVVLPTITALLGYEVAANPCSYDFVKYRISFTPTQIDKALTRRDVYWVHPVPRRYDDRLRKRIRDRLAHYANAPEGESAMSRSKPNSGTGLVLSLPILQRMKKIDGWLEEDEADLLIAAASHALTALPGGSAVVEIGSYCGRSTVVLASVAQLLGAKTMVYAIDPHDGKVGALDQGVQSHAPTLDVFRHNIAANGLSDVVESVQKRSFEVAWNKPIALLFVDGLHDYANVARDFHHFERWILPGGYIAFHDYADYYPGVKAFVNEILALPLYEKVECVRSMMLVRRAAASDAHDDTAERSAVHPRLNGLMREETAPEVAPAARRERRKPARTIVS